MRITDMITQDEFTRYFINLTSPHYFTLTLSQFLLLYYFITISLFVLIFLQRIHSHFFIMHSSTGETQFFR